MNKKIDSLIKKHGEKAYIVSGAVVTPVNWKTEKENNSLSLEQSKKPLWKKRKYESLEAMADDLSENYTIYRVDYTDSKTDQSLEKNGLYFVRNDSQLPYAIESLSRNGNYVGETIEL